jgi:hypothetical protein
MPTDFLCLQQKSVTLEAHNAQMKYHYQFVSKTTVRIELIAEDNREREMIISLSASTESDERLIDLFKKGLQAYSTNVILTKSKFMNFPKVALCSYTVPVPMADHVAQY